MFCTQCGANMAEDDRFCPKCGNPVKPEFATARPTPVRLSRPFDERKIAGVCAGFARYFDVDVTLMRILWLAATVFTGGLGILVYIAAWILMPRDPRPLAQPQTVTRAA